MPVLLRTLAALLCNTLRPRLSLQLEILALRHQLAVYQRSVRCPRICRILWSWLSRHWARWREALVFVQPSTVIAWRQR